MNFFNMIYGGRTPKEDAPPEVVPKGMKLLGFVLKRKWWELIKLNIIFWAICLPVVTIPAALKAMSRVEIQYLRGRPISLWTEFLDSFKEHFFRTTGIGALMALIFVALTYGVVFYGTAMQTNGMFAVPTIFLLLAAVAEVMMLFYLFPLLAFSELKLKDMLRNSLLLVLARLPQNLAALAVIAVIVVAYVLFFPYSTFVLAAFALSLAWLVVCFASWPGLAKHVFHLD